MILSYNKNIFTKVNKWDSTYSYYGILISGKLNQYNGQGYKLVDIIDVDWDGAYISKLNTYLYTSEDLINILDKYAGNFSYISNNYVKYSYLDDFVNYTEEHFTELIEEKSAYNQTYILHSVLESLTFDYDILNSISELVLDRTKYIEVPYGELDLDNETAEYYIFQNNKYILVDKEYILSHPDDTYYEFLIKDIINIQKDIKNIKAQIGVSYFNDNTQEYSYTGFYENFYNIDNNISYLYNYSNEINERSYDAYNYGYIAYNTSNKNKEIIGYASQYNVYTLTDHPEENQDNLYIYNNGSYIKANYLPQYTGKYYILNYKLDGSGIIKDIEDLKEQSIDNSNILNNLKTKNLDEENIIFNINNNSENYKEKIITIDLIKSLFTDENGKLTTGLINNYTLDNVLSYITDWNILN